MHTQQMLATHPDVGLKARGRPSKALVAAIEAAYDCAQATSACADACVAEADTALVQCIRMNLDCADVCSTTGLVATRRAGSNDTVVTGLLMLCEAPCHDWASECERHARHRSHCRICAKVCRRCEAACRAARAGAMAEQVQQNRCIAQRCPRSLSLGRGQPYRFRIVRTHSTRKPMSAMTTTATATST